MPESIGPVHWRLQVPHLGLADYRRLQRLMLRQYGRRRTPVALAIGGAIGIVMGALAVAATEYWDIRMSGGVVVRIARHPLLILRDHQLSWAALALLLAGVAAMTLCVAINYRALVRRIFDTSRRTTPHWSLEIGDDGFHMVLNEIVATIPWSDVLGLQSSKTASFLTLTGYFKALGISHAAFASDADRDTCLTFMKAKLPSAQKLPASKS